MFLLFCMFWEVPKRRRQLGGTKKLVIGHRDRDPGYRDRDPGYRAIGDLKSNLQISSGDLAIPSALHMQSF